MNVQISLPEILAVCACILFVSGEYLVGSIFLSLSVIAGVTRAAVKLQESKTQQENFERALKMISHIGSYVEEFLNGVIFVGTQQQINDDDDTSNYN